MGLLDPSFGKLALTPVWGWLGQPPSCHVLRFSCFCFRDALCSKDVPMPEVLGVPATPSGCELPQGHIKDSKLAFLCFFFPPCSEGLPEGSCRRLERSTLNYIYPLTRNVFTVILRSIYRPPHPRIDFLLWCDVRSMACVPLFIFLAFPKQQDELETEKGKELRSYSTPKC